MRPLLTPIRMLLGFFAGFIAVLVFQQPVLALLYSLHVAARPAYSSAMTMPMGVPYVWSEAFWGGVWGVVLGALDSRWAAGGRLWQPVVVYSAVVPTLFEWFLQLAIVHGPFGGAWTLGVIVTPFIINACWGLGTEVVLSGLDVAWRLQEPPASRRW